MKELEPTNMKTLVELIKEKAATGHIHNTKGGFEPIVAEWAAQGHASPFGQIAEALEHIRVETCERSDLRINRIRESHRRVTDNLHAVIEELTDTGKAVVEQLKKEHAAQIQRVREQMKREVENTVERFKSKTTVDGSLPIPPAGFIAGNAPGCNQDGSESGTGRFKPKKPPLGLRPDYIADAERLEEINAAIGRYLDAGQHVPFDWYQEQTAIQDRIKQREDAKQKKASIAKQAATVADDCLKSLGIAPSMEINEHSHDYRHAMEQLTPLLITLLTKRG